MIVNLKVLPTASAMPRLRALPGADGAPNASLSCLPHALSRHIGIDTGPDSGSARLITNPPTSRSVINLGLHLSPSATCYMLLTVGSALSLHTGLLTARWQYLCGGLHCSAICHDSNNASEPSNVYNL